MGIETPSRHNPAMMLGAPHEGFTPLEMAHAFRPSPHAASGSAATSTRFPGNEKDPRDDGPVAINKIVNADGKTIDENEREEGAGALDERRRRREVDPRAVIVQRHRRDASLGGDDWGKTGTTENYGDAWFCGGTDHFTACVWVGHAQTNTPMETEYGGEPGRRRYLPGRDLGLGDVDRRGASTRSTRPTDERTRAPTRARQLRQRQQRRATAAPSSAQLRRAAAAAAAVAAAARGHAGPARPLRRRRRWRRHGRRHRRHRALALAAA